MTRLTRFCHWAHPFTATQIVVTERSLAFDADNSGEIGLRDRLGERADLPVLNLARPSRRVGNDLVGGGKLRILPRYIRCDACQDLHHFRVLARRQLD